MKCELCGCDRELADGTSVPGSSHVCGEESMWVCRGCYDPPPMSAELQQVNQALRCIIDIASGYPGNAAMVGIEDAAWRAVSELANHLCKQAAEARAVRLTGEERRALAKVVAEECLSASTKVASVDMRTVEGRLFSQVEVS